MVFLFTSCLLLAHSTMQEISKPFTARVREENNTVVPMIWRKCDCLVLIFDIHCLLQWADLKMMSQHVGFSSGWSDSWSLDFGTSDHDENILWFYLVSATSMANNLNAPYVRFIRSCAPKFSFSGVQEMKIHKSSSYRTDIFRIKLKTGNNSLFCGVSRDTDFDIYWCLTGSFAEHILEEKLWL